MHACKNVLRCTHAIIVYYIIRCQTPFEQYDWSEKLTTMVVFQFGPNGVSTIQIYKTMKPPKKHANN